MILTTKEIGEFGERVACEYLEDKGYDILKRNFRVKTGEIDIIAKDDECTVFVEVKTRQNNNFGEPSEAVDYRKQQKLIKTAACYTDIENNEIRFDVVEVFYDIKDMKVLKVNHIENAF